MFVPEIDLDVFSDLAMLHSLFPAFDLSLLPEIDLLPGDISQNFNSFQSLTSSNLRHDAFPAAGVKHGAGWFKLKIKAASIANIDGKT